MQSATPTEDVPGFPAPGQAQSLNEGFYPVATIYGLSTIRTDYHRLSGGLTFPLAKWIAVTIPAFVRVGEPTPTAPCGQPGI